ncbi:beta-glucoside-specific PTS transporter subunit IIABC [Bacillus sp. 37MA]|uniref:beta-glucoside-specific PTS transporter subunit IIABC n=1 Tax=Bacillus sp. 37MA TaxID=1132442 RepID=UPI0003724D8D|nr:beta-glucoside-specific PTS transporter subunit IIABC [Bacillus sp. 37MA]
MNDQQLAKKILQHVGGEQNVSSLHPSATQLGIEVKDKTKVNKSALENMKAIINVEESNEQFQIKIEGSVEDLYKEIKKLGDFTNDSTSEEKEKESMMSKILGIISGSFAPILGVLAGSGLLKALLTVLTMLGWMSTESSTYAILSAAGHAIFYFLPIFLGITLSIKLGASPYVGGTIGAALLEPSFTNLAANGAKSVDFLGIPVVLMSYSSTVFPIFIAVAIYAVLDKFLKKVIYKDIQMFVNPMISLLIIVPLTVLIFGPFGVYVGEAIGAGIEFLSSKSGLLTGAVLGSAWTFLTIMGLHWAIIPIAIANLAIGEDPIIGMAAAAPFAQIGMALGIFLKTKDKDLKGLSATAILPSVLAGTTELINYGIILRYKRTMLYVAIAGAVGGAINGSLGVKMTVFSFPSLLTIPAFSPMLQYVIGIAVALVLGMVLTYIFGYEDKNEKASSKVKFDTGQISVKRETIGSPLSGEIIPLYKISEPLFATQTVGKGIAIEPEKGEVVSPMDGVVTTLFPTEHAVGITSEGGAEILINIGIDTVNLKGQFFTSHVKQGDKVRQGDLLIEFDIEKIKAAGYQVITPVVITNTSQYLDVVKTKNSFVNVKDDLLTVIV